MKHAVRTAIAFASLCLCSGAGAEIVTYQLPSYAGGCQVTGINDNGQATGHCADNRNAGAIFGFVLEPNGTLTMFNVAVPIPVTAKFNAEQAITSPTGITADGVVTGWYWGYYGPTYYGGGFSRVADGSIKTVQVGPGISTRLLGANKKGWTVGQYGQRTPFLRARSGATQEFQVPHANGGAAATVVNRSRTIAGSAVVDGGTAAFFRPAHGTAALFGGTHWATNVTGINDAGTVVGWYVQVPGEDYTAFIRTSDGTITTFVGPNGTWALAQAINNSGSVAGTFVDNTNAPTNGFIRAADGTFTAFNLQGAFFTQVQAISDKGAIAGFAAKGNGYVLFAGKP